MNSHFFDQLPIAWLFLLTVVLMILMLESGYRFGVFAEAKSAKAQVAQVRALMGATLGLLAFMLAFTFSSAQSHFEARMQLQIDEAVLAKTAFMQADLAEEPLRTDARKLLLEFVDGRVQFMSAVKVSPVDDAFAIFRRADQIHLELWSLGKNDRPATDDAADGSAVPAEFMPSVLGLMDAQTFRVQAALVNRIPVIIWLNLYFTAVMSMLVVGYQAGLTSRRSPIATYSLALAFAAVMMLITDLDRPLQSFFAVDVAVMEQAADFMRNEL